jgi:hypothetical protein
MVFNNINNNNNNNNSNNHQQINELNTKLANMLQLNSNNPQSLSTKAKLGCLSNFKLEESMTKPQVVAEASPVASVSAAAAAAIPIISSTTNGNKNSSANNSKILSNEDKKINLNALKNQDPFATNILDTALRVAVYKFVSKKNEWKKLDVEGSLFLFERMVEPLHSFVVMNTLALNLFLQPITFDLEFQDRNPFLLYKSNNDIYGIWFIDKEDCGRIKTLIVGLTDSAKDRRNKREQKSKANISTTTSLSLSHTSEYEIKSSTANLTSATSTHSLNLITTLSPETCSMQPQAAATSTFNQILSLTSTNPLNVNNTNRDNNEANTVEQQVDILQMLTKAQVQYDNNTASSSNNHNNMLSKTAVLDPPTSHSTPGSLSTQSLVGVGVGSASGIGIGIAGEPKPMSQWPHELFLNSNQFIKPEPLRQPQQQQQQHETVIATSNNNNSLFNTSCSPPSSTKSSSSASSQSSSLLSSVSSNNGLIHLLTNNGLVPINSYLSLTKVSAAPAPTPNSHDELSLELKRKLNIKIAPPTATATPTSTNSNSDGSNLINTLLSSSMSSNSISSKPMRVQDFEENILKSIVPSPLPKASTAATSMFYLPSADSQPTYSMNTTPTSTTTANTSTEYISQTSLKFSIPNANKKDRSTLKKTKNTKKIHSKSNKINASSSSSNSVSSYSGTDTSSSSSSSSSDDDDSSDSSPNTLPLLLTPAAFESSSTASSIISSSAFNNNNSNNKQQHFFSCNNIVNSDFNQQNVLLSAVNPLSDFNNSNSLINENKRRAQASNFLLTKEQLQETLIYLLNTDDQFLNTLHQAYIKCNTLKLNHKVETLPEIKTASVAASTAEAAATSLGSQSSKKPVKASSYATALNKQQ